MYEEDRFEILVCPEDGSGAHTQTMKLVENPGYDLNLIVKEVPHYETAVELLDDGKCDMIAVSGHWWYANHNRNLSAGIILARREPTKVLVCEDKTEYIPKKGIIVVDSELLRRQMLRARPDLEIILVADMKDAPTADIERATWLEDKRLDTEIDGYVVKRSVHSALPFRSRRHTLGLQRDNPERFRIVPQPLEGFTILLTRLDFPAKRFDQIIDAGAALSLRLEMMILDHVDSDMHDMLGLMVEQRKVATVLKEARRAGEDLSLKGIVTDKGVVRHGNTRIDIVMEALNPEGTVTASVEKVFPPEESHSAILNLLNDWNSLLSVMTDTPQEETRGRIKELMDAYVDKMVGHGAMDPDKIGEPMMNL
jgi:hypothetical protein